MLQHALHTLVHLAPRSTIIRVRADHVGRDHLLLSRLLVQRLHRLVQLIHLLLRHQHLRVLRETGDQRGEQFRRVRQSLHVMSYCYPYCQRLLLQVKAQRHRLLRVNFSLLRQRFYTSSCFDASNRRRRSAPPSRATLGTPATPSTRPDRWNCSVVVEEYTLQQTDSSARN